MPLWTCSSMDNCIPMFKALRAQGLKCGASDLGPVRMTARKVQQEISPEGVCDLHQPVFLSALFLHTSTDCSHSFHWCHIGIGSSLLQNSHPRHRIATFIQLGSGAMVSVEQANEIVAKLRELETEQIFMKDLFNRALRMSQSGTTRARDVQRQGHRIH